MSERDRLLLISADCHAGPLPETIRSYVSSKHLAAFDAWQADQAGMLARRAEHTGEAIYGDEALADFGVEDAVTHGGIDGAFDSKRRQAELEQDGIVAEVIFPGGSMKTVSPFGSGLMTYQYAQDEAIWWEGCRAYNRWLVDFCGADRRRLVPIAHISLLDPEGAVGEVERAMRSVWAVCLACSTTTSNSIRRFRRDGTPVLGRLAVCLAGVTSENRRATDVLHALRVPNAVCRTVLR